MLIDEIFSNYVIASDLLVDIQELLDKKYLDDIEPDEANYGHVGDLIQIGIKLKEIRDFLES